MKPIDLNNLIRDKEYFFLKKYNIKIEKIKIIKETMEMEVNLISDKIIKNKDIKAINQLFNDSFNNFNISINNKYNYSEIKDTDLKEYLKELRSMILTQVPSSKSWIEDMNIKLNERVLTLILPKNIKKINLKVNGLIKELNNKIKNELDVELNIIESKVSIEDNNNYLNNKDIEAKEISRKIVEEGKENLNKKENKEFVRKKSYSLGRNINSSPVPIKDVTMESGNTVIKGEIFDIEKREIRNNRLLVTLYVTDNTDSIPAKIFLSEKQQGEFLENIEIGDYVLLQGDVNYDSFSRMESMIFNSIKRIEKEIRKDLSKEKRVELHLHTKMSAMDGVSDVKDLIKRAHEWGHEAIAITDHGVVQAFPEAMNEAEKLGIKLIYGMEGYLVDDKKEIVTNYKPKIDYDTFVIFDIETTGLSAINDGITEIGAIKVKDGKVFDTFTQLVNPEKKIPEFITELTGITNEMVKDKPVIESVISEFKEFIGDSVLVAHNATFDIGFIREKMKLIDENIDMNPVLDTLELSRAIFPDSKNHKLDTIAKILDVKLENHHRAVDDAKATAEILLKILEVLKERNISKFDDINELVSEDAINKSRPYHVTILAKNLKGLKNLYKLVSKSHIDYFYRNPRIPKSVLEEYREGLLIGSACEAGELYKAILNRKSNDEIRDIVNFYDYLEIQPLGNNMHLIRNQILKDTNQLENINREIYELGKRYNKPVVATGDVHFLEPQDEVYRRILMTGQGFKDAEEQPPLYFKTTDEMLREFEYLGKDVAKEVVIKNTNYLNEKIENIRAIPKGTYPPVLEGSAENLREITYKKAYEVYGNPLPEIVSKRLERELNSIISNNYAVMYIIGQKLVWKSIEDGYLVGSRGSVGSSFAATMSGITEVNPLEPHYVCPNCQYSKFFTDGTISSGADMKDANCPKCETKLIKDGHDIPFEVFLGFEGDKEPDIDLNFASEYQAKAHMYTEKLFGEGYVYRAGTIGTIADKTAYGFVKKYFEQKGENVNPAETNRLVKGCSGVRRSSGQHPGGVMIVPQDKEIFDFSPIQYPANDKEAGVITTHFDYDAISSQILKLDILGHDVPTIIKMLEDFTGINPTKIPLDEKETMKIFSSTESLGIKPEDIDCEVGTLGIPEFGTKFVRQMLVDTKPDKFSDLVRISGLSHGTDVWLNNAQLLVRNNEATLSEVISTREDIMLTLINAGLDKQQSFLIMEKVRKGIPLMPEEIESMEELDLPAWYIDSCNKIKYMFPKAHAVAYVMMSFRIAYFKVYYPEAFYATYFTTKAIDFDAELICKGLEAIELKIKEIESLGNDATAKEKNTLTVLEVAREMYHRGYKFTKVDLYNSDSDKFMIKENGILPPLKGLDGVGENAAKNIVEARKEGEFISVEELIERTGVTKTVIEALKNHGCLEGIPESNQLNLFNM